MWRAPRGQVDRDHLLGAGVDDVEHAVAQQRCPAGAAVRRRRSRSDPPTRTTRPAPDSATRHAPSGADRHADRFAQPGRQHLDGARPQRHAPVRCPVRRTPHPPGADRDTVELVESVCQHLAFARRRPVAGDLATRGRHDELAGPARRQAAQESGIARAEQHPDGLQRAVGCRRRRSRCRRRCRAGRRRRRPDPAASSTRPATPFALSPPARISVISPVKLETNSRSPTKVQLSRPGVSWASTRLVAGAGIDAQHLPAGHLRRDDVAVRSRT